ncbi:MAG: plasmid mobilization relaxosome protein MobC [Acidobacteriota bacterium]
MTDSPQHPRPITLGGRFSVDEADLVRLRAQRSRLTVSTYLRSLALDAPDVQQPRLLVDPELVRQIIRVGVNLNQIARKLNAGHLVDGFGLRQCLVDTLVALDRVTERIAEEARQ